MKSCARWALLGLVAAVNAVQAEPAPSPSAMLAPQLTLPPADKPPDHPPSALVSDQPPVLSPFEEIIRDGYLSAGGGFYVIQPYFQGNPVGVLRTNGPVTVRQQMEFRQHMEVAPLAWLAYLRENGLGFRARYFEFCQWSGDSFLMAPNQSMTSASPLGLTITAGANEGFVGASDLMVHAWDFETVRIWKTGSWGILGSAGIRYAHVAQNYHALATGTTITDGELLLSGHNFNGAGPTAALEIKRRILDSGLALYSNARGSILFGSAKQRAFRQTRSNTTGLVTGGEESAAFQGEVLPIGELELGAEYMRPLGRFYALAQIGMVGQVWWGGGNASNSNGMNGSTFRAESSSNFGFLGLAFRFGLTF